MQSTLVIPERVRYVEQRWRGLPSTHQGEWVVICSTEIFYAIPAYYRTSIEGILHRIREGGVYKLCDGSFSGAFCQQSATSPLLIFDEAFDDETLLTLFKAIYPRYGFINRFGQCEVFNGNHFLGYLLQLLEYGN